MTGQPAAWRRAVPALLALAAFLLASALPDRPAHAQTAQTVQSDWSLIPKDSENNALVTAGQSFRLLFVTSTSRDGRISQTNQAPFPTATANSFVQARANTNNTLKPFKDEFRAVYSTSATDARDNTATTYTNANKGVPIYWVGGDRVANDYADFYDGSWDSTAAKNESGSARRGHVRTNSNDDGTFHVTNEVSSGGIPKNFLGFPNLGDPFTWLKEAISTDSALYALSPVIMVEAPDTTGPAVSSLAVTSSPPAGQGGYYKAGDKIAVTVTFDEAITVTGTPTLKVRVGTGTGSEKTASCAAHASQDTKLVCTYTVTSGDLDTDGIAVERNKLRAGSGVSIKDSSDNNATLTYAAARALGNQSGHKVDTVAPAAPGGFAASAGIGQARLTWSAPSPADATIAKYQYRQKAGTAAWGGWSDVAGGAAARARTVTGLMSGTAYRFQLRAVDAATNAGASSAAGPVTPLAVGTGAPVGQTVAADWALIPKDTNNNPLVAAGGKFRLLFVTSTQASAPTSTNISTYNAFVQKAAGNNANLRSFATQFRAVISTSTTDARDNTATTGTGVPIYWVQGDRVANNYADFYDGSWDSVTRKTETGGTTTFCCGVWTGSNNDGTKHTNHAGHSSGSYRFGVTTAGQSPISAFSLPGSAADLPLYAISPVLTVSGQTVTDTTAPSVMFGAATPRVGTPYSITLTDTGSKVAKYAVVEVSGTATDATGCDDPSADGFTLTAVSPAASPEVVSHTPAGAGKKLCVYAEDATGNSRGVLHDTVIVGAITIAVTPAGEWITASTVSVRFTFVTQTSGNTWVDLYHVTAAATSCASGSHRTSFNLTKSVTGQGLRTVTHSAPTAALHDRKICARIYDHNSNRYSPFSRVLKVDTTDPGIEFPSAAPRLGAASTIKLTDATAKIKKYGAIVVPDTATDATGCDTAAEIGSTNLTTLTTPDATVNFPYTPPAGSVGKQVCAYAEDAAGNRKGALWTTAILGAAAKPKVALVLAASTITESGSGNATTLKATLPSAVSSATTVTLTATPASGVVNLSGTTLTIAANATQSGTVNVTAVNNDVDADNATVTISGATSGTAVLAPDAVTLTVSDDDTKGVTLSSTSVDVNEGATATYTVKLDTEPTASVVVTPASEDTGAVTVSTSAANDTLTFTTSNWSTAQTVTVTGVEDADSTDESVTVSHSLTGGGYGSVSVDDVTVAVDDDEAVVSGPSITAVAVTSTPGGSHATYGLGDDIVVTVTFDKAIVVTGAPRLGVRVGARERSARCARKGASGDDAKRLECTYRVTTADTDADGIAIEAGKLTVPGSFTTIQDAGGRDASLAYTATGPLAAHKVDGVVPPQSDNFRAVAGNQEVRLTWDAVSDASLVKYQYQYQQSTDAMNFGSDWTDVPGGSAAVAHTVTGLTNGTSYYFQLRAVDRGGNASRKTTFRGAVPSVAAGQALLDVPLAPTGLAAAANGATAIDLSWTAPTADATRAAVTRYHIQWSADGNAPWTSLVHRGTATSATHGRLSGSTTRHYRVRALSWAGPGPWSASASGTTAPVGPPLAPADLNATRFGRNAIDLSWTAPAADAAARAAVTGYEIEWSADGNAPWTALSHSGTGTSARHSGLSTDTTRHYRVRATSAAGAGPWSLSASATTGAAPGLPPAPELAADVLRGDAIRLYWSALAREAAVTAWVLEVSADGGATWSALVTLHGGRRTYDHEVARGTMRHYRMKARNATGDGPWSAAVSQTLPSANAPERPEGFSVTAVASGLRLAWTSPGDASVTGWEYRQALAASYVGAATGWGAWRAIRGSNARTVSHVVTGLVANIAYRFQVRAAAGAEKGVPSRVEVGTVRRAVAGPAALVVPWDWPYQPKDANDDPVYGDGAQFRLLFVTRGRRDAASFDIAEYNRFVQGEAVFEGARALLSTIAVDARDNTATTYTDTDKGVPIYWKGGARAANDYMDFYDGRWASGGLLGGEVWTGSTSDGTKFENLDGSGPAGAARVMLGRATAPGARLSLNETAPSGWSRALYGLSPVITISGAQPVPGPKAMRVYQGSGEQGENSLLVKWRRVEGRGFVCDYRVEWKETALSESDTGAAFQYSAERRLSVSGLSTSPHTFITELTPGTSYTVRVRRSGRAYYSPWFLVGEKTFVLPGQRQVETPAPALSWARVNGAELALRFDAALDESSVPAGSAFAVSVAGASRAVSAVAVSQETVTLTLGEAVTPGEVVTLGYTPPSQAKLRASGGGTAVAAFSGQAVTNDTPAEQPGRQAALTASVASAPAEHRGRGGFTVQVAFSEAVAGGAKAAAKTMQVTGGTLVRARRAGGAADRWAFDLRPSGHGAVTLTLPATTDCAAAGAVCTADGRKLETALTHTVPGPAMLSVADARATEGEDATIDFAVTLSRAVSGEVTVRYVTRDATAKVGRDYRKAKGTLTFAAGEKAAHSTKVLI